MFEEYDSLQAHTKDWIFLESPTKISMICFTYLVFVLYAGPKYMENRKPFSLKYILMGYNLFQVYASYYLTKNILQNGISVKDTVVCYYPDYSESPANMRRTTLFYYAFLLKIVELVETIFFVLRKKDKQISTLHLYHHISTIFIAYFGAKFIGCGPGCILLVLNLVVHFFMYMYYFLSSFGDAQWQRKLIFFKKAITKFQIVQFLIMLVAAAIYTSQKCIDPIGWIGLSFGLPDILILLYMFVKFYIESYNKSKTKSNVSSPLENNTDVQKVK